MWLNPLSSTSILFPHFMSDTAKVSKYGVLLQIGPSLSFANNYIDTETHFFKYIVSLAAFTVP